MLGVWCQLRVQWVLLALALACGLAAPSALRAQALVGGAQPSGGSTVEGFAPDAQLVGGLGFGLDGKLDNYFLARGRLGALYATEPWIVNLGLTAEVGALAGIGWGGELELSRGGSFFGNVGVSRIDNARWMMHAGVGFTIFGLEWQHTFEGPNPSNALLLEVRLPLGLWWLQKRQEKAGSNPSGTMQQAPPIKQRIGHPPPSTPDASERQAAAQEAAAPQPTNDAPRSAAAESGAGQPTAKPTNHGSTGAGQRGPTATDAVAVDAEYGTRLAEAKAAREKGDHLAEALALSRAYALRPDVSVVLQLVAAELALAKPRSALADWHRLGDVDALPPPDRDHAQQLRQRIATAISHVRLDLTGAPAADLTTSIDGIAEPIAIQGYDVPLDPGSHTLQLRRGDSVLVERAFETKAGALLRLSIDVPR